MHTWSNPVHWGASKRLVGWLREENDPGKLGPSDGFHFSDFRRGTLARGMTAAMIGRQSRCASLMSCVRYLTASARSSTGCRLKRFKQGDRKKQRKAPSPWPDPWGVWVHMHIIFNEHFSTVETLFGHTAYCLLTLSHLTYICFYEGSEFP